MTDTTDIYGKCVERINGVMTIDDNLDGTVTVHIKPDSQWGIAHDGDSIIKNPYKSGDNKILECNVSGSSNNVDGTHKLIEGETLSIISQWIQRKDTLAILYIRARDPGDKDPPPPPPKDPDKTDYSFLIGAFIIGVFMIIIAFYLFYKAGVI